ncbi:MAG: tRNA threonylcarbamoyladenosine biosynthesis protein TsaE [Sphingobacteriales bacterium]|jgi:tRNA threonylcarbamoyladenosine biosynthesis protein TsaE
MSVVKEISVHNVSELPQVAAALLAFAGGNNVFVISGTMGMGKTTLVKEVCKQMGVTDEVSSPTYTIVSEYVGVGGPVYHFDFYRLKSVDEALDIGIEDYFYSGNPCFIEWPDLIEDYIPTPFILVEIEGEGTSRKFKFFSCV